MGLGAFAAIGQTNIKRLLAYSAIGNIGYALIGLAAASPGRRPRVIVYMVIYVVMTLGAFACVLAMRRPGGMVEDIDELAGLAQTNLAMATVLALLLFSLAGIPPLAGFFAKFYVFVAAGEGGAVGAGRVRRARQRGRCLLLRAHRQDHVLRCAEGEVSSTFR
jgi:NADH-quinone oxidoreductase subunit N